MKTIINKIGVHLPNNPINNVDFSKKFAHTKLNPNLLKGIFGAEQRFIANKDEQCSDMAVKAAQKILDKFNMDDIDLLIYASASGDLIEPATSNIVQHKLGLTCPVMDIKNACNSVVTAIQVASTFIGQKIHKNILIVAGEKLSNTIRFNAKNRVALKSNIAALSFGDAGAALLLSASDKEEGFIYQSFLSLGKHWKLSTVPGGGSLNPFDSDKNYFHGHTNALIDTLKNGKAKKFILYSIEESPWDISEIDLVITHQVAMSVYKIVSVALNIPTKKIHQVFNKYGNTAAASIPLALHDAMEAGEAKKGDKILLLGLAAGISVSVQMVVL